MALNRFQSHAVSKPSYGYGYGLLFVLFNLIFTAFFWWQLPPQIPLFYSLPYGPMQLANKLWFFILPVLTISIWVSYILLSKIKTNTLIYVQILKWLQLTSLVLITITLIHIVLVVL
jgi:hypothetical protein